jgi:lambda repressor-like predicted transcriptional regulator
MTSMNVTSSTTAMFTTQSGSTSKSPLDVAAQLFGMSKVDLTSELKSGKSLDDVAKEKGVSTDDLDNALVANMPTSMANSGNAQQAAQSIASKVRLPSGHHHHGPPPSSSTSSDSTSDSSTSSGTSSSTGSSDVLSELSTLLNTDPTSLKSSLSSGTSLSDLLSQSGISMDTLADTLQQGMLLDTTA